MTLNELKDLYYSDCNVLEQPDKKFIASFKRAEGSPYWGQGEIDKTGWVQLARFSPNSKGGKETVIVCTAYIFKRTSRID